MQTQYHPTFCTRFVLPEPEALGEAIRDARLEPSMLGPGDGPSMFEQFRLPQVCLEYVTVAAPFLFRGTMAKDAYTMIFVDVCPRSGNSLNFSMNHDSGYMGFFPPGGEIEAITPAGLCTATLTVPVVLMQCAAEHCFPEIPQRVLKHGIGIRLAQPDCARLRSLVRELRRESGQRGSLLAETAAQSQLEGDLLSAFLESMRNALTQGETKQAPAGLARRQALLRQAVEVIEENPLSADSTRLCIDLKCSRRKMEYIFHELAGMSPARFIKAVRLRKVRTALLSMDADAGLVKAAALDAGFWHFGHFSNDYRALFGERPVDTLRRQA